MSSPRPGSEQAPNPAGIAKEMRVKGMNTAKIMIALFEMDISIKDVMRTGNDIVSNALKTDIQAARLRDKLKTTVEKAVDQLGVLVTTTQDNIAKLGTVKTTTEISKNYNNQLNPFMQKYKDLEANNEELLKKANAFISELRELLPTIADQSKEIAKHPEITAKLTSLIDQQRQLRDTVRKLYESKDFDMLSKDLHLLATESERTTRAAGLKIGEAPAIGTTPKQS